MQKLDYLGRHCDEVQINIFSFLERQDLAKMNRVSKKTQKAAATERLWKEIYMSERIHLIGLNETVNIDLFQWKQRCYRTYYERSPEKLLYNSTVEKGDRHNGILSYLVTAIPSNLAATMQGVNAICGMDVQTSLLVNAVVAFPLAIANFKSDNIQSDYIYKATAVLGFPSKVIGPLTVDRLKKVNVAAGLALSTMGAATIWNGDVSVGAFTLTNGLYFVIKGSVPQNVMNRFYGVAVANVQLSANRMLDKIKHWFDTFE